MFDIERVPEWAHTWCWIFAYSAVATVISALIMVFTLKKVNAMVVFAILASAAIQAVTAMVLFWMCRRCTQ
jgi:hypothetical protein